MLALIQKIKVIKRFNRILAVFLKAGFKTLIYDYGFKKHLSPFRRLKRNKERDDVEMAVKLRLAIEELGPVFVKFGQILSTRSDFLPRAYIEELQKLQSKVPPFPFIEAKRIIEE